MAVQPKCSICGKDLMSNDGYEVQEVRGEMVKTLKEEQIKYWAHDPKNIHVDVEVIAHKTCYDQVKITYKSFDKPVQTDYAAPVFPVIEKGTVVTKTPEELLSFKDSVVKSIESLI